MSSFDKKSIDAATAKAMIAAAAAKASEIGVMACISIVDDAGDLKAFLRMDGAAKLALDISQNKAFTAVSFGMSTDQWWEFIKDDAPLLHGITHTPRLTVFGGGYPIREGDHVIGGIGVSGGHYSQDMQIANAGLASLGT